MQALKKKKKKKACQNIRITLQLLISFTEQKPWQTKLYVLFQNQALKLYPFEINKFFIDWHKLGINLQPSFLPFGVRLFACYVFAYLGRGGGRCQSWLFSFVNPGRQCQVISDKTPALFTPLSAHGTDCFMAYFLHTMPVPPTEFFCLGVTHYLTCHFYNSACQIGVRSLTL